MGSDIIKVVPKVNSLGFVLNERLTATDHFKKEWRQKVNWILRSLRPHASHTPLEVRSRMTVSLIMPHIGMGVMCMLVRMLRYNGGCGFSLRRLHHVKKDKWRQVLWVLRWLIIRGFSFCRFFTCVACPSVLVVLGCRAWITLPHDMKIFPTYTDKNY
jgi:hypothetical protein